MSKQIYLICDNQATHKHSRIQRWIEMHVRFFSAIQNHTGFARQNQTIGLSRMSLALA